MSAYTHEQRDIHSTYLHINMRLKEVKNAAMLAVLTSAISLLVDDQFTAVDIVGLAPSQVLLASSPQLFAGSFSTDYCLSSWIKAFALPVGTVSPATLKTASKVNIGLRIGPAGNIWAFCDLYNGATVSITATQVLVINTWFLIAGCACSSQLSISVVQYRGLAAFTSLPLSSFVIEYNPLQSSLQVYSDGANPITAQMAALTLHLDICLTADSLTSQATVCSPRCEMCIGPTYSSCMEYVQLVDPFKPATVLPVAFPGTSDIFDGRDYSSADIAMTGWVWFNTRTPGYVNIFKVENKACEISLQPQDGCRVLSLYVDQNTWILGQFFDTVTAANVGVNAGGSMGYFSNTWYFFTASNCPGTASTHQCQSYFASYLFTCYSGKISSASYQFFRDSATASIRVNGVTIGKLLDVRYYPGRCISPTEAQALLTQRQGVSCLPGCSSCSQVDVCSGCSDGFYLDTAGLCQRCNSCCLTCVGGPENNKCVKCASFCSLIATGTCIRK